MKERGGRRGRNGQNYLQRKRVLTVPTDLSGIPGMIGVGFADGCHQPGLIALIAARTSPRGPPNRPIGGFLVWVELGERKSSWTRKMISS